MSVVTKLASDILKVLSVLKSCVVQFIVIVLALATRLLSLCGLVNSTNKAQSFLLFIAIAQA